MNHDDSAGAADSDSTPTTAEAARAGETPSPSSESLIGEPEGLTPQANDDTPEAGGSIASRAPTWAAVILLLLIAAVVNFPYQYVVSSDGLTGAVNSPIDFKIRSTELPTMAGWPFRYWIAYDGEAPSTRFSARALFYNAGLALLVVAVMAFYIHRRNQKVLRGKLAPRKLTIADLLVITLLLAVPLGAWQRLSVRNKAETEFSQQLLRVGGKTIVAAWVPRPLSSLLPKWMTVKLRRLRAVRLEHPSDELAAKLCELKTLTCLRMGGGTYDLRLLDQLYGDPHLHDLRVSGRVIDADAFRWIASNRRLDTLNLMRTNVSAEALNQLTEMPRLSRVNLIHSDVVLADLGKPKWAETVTVLKLPHPQPGDASSLTIQAWPRLQELYINELDSQTNSSAMVVNISEAPKLKTLGLDLFQKFDLTLRDLPELDTLSPLAHEWQSRIPRGGAAPGQIWCSRFDAEGLPKLQELFLFGNDLEHFEVRESPNFEMLGFAAFFKTVSASTYASKLTPQAAKAMIEGVSRSDGPTTCDLDAVPLAGVDLSPLAKNRRLERVMLSQSDTEWKQWKGLAPMTWLKRLDVKDCEIDNRGIRWVLDTFPDLEHVAFTVGSDEFGFIANENFTLEVVDRPKLKTLDLGEMDTSFLSAVKLVNTEQLSMSLNLGYVERLEVVNAPALTGFSVAGPMPEAAKLSGFRDLQFFAVGGPTVDDQVIASLVDCRQLKTLTIAYPKVTAEGLRKIQGLQDVVALTLPGSAVDDSVLAAWPEMPKLRYLDLRDTKVTGEGIASRLAGPHLTRVALSGCKVQASDLAPLADAGVGELLVAGIGLDSATLKGILDGGALKRLDVSDTSLPDDFFDLLLSDAGRLQHLMLRNCEVDDRKLGMVAARYPRLRFDLSGSTVSTKTMTQLLSSRRIVDASEWDQYVGMQAMMASMQTGGAPRGDKRPEIIDVDFFADYEAQMKAMMMAPPMGNPTIFRAGPAPPSAIPATLGGQAIEWLRGAMTGGTPPISRVYKDEVSTVVADEDPSADDSQNRPSTGREPNRKTEE